MNQVKTFIYTFFSFLLVLLISFPVRVGALELSKDSFVAQAIEKTGSAVVRIDTEKTVNREFDPFSSPFFNDPFGGGMNQKRIIAGQGSGFIVDSDGYILTNAHVVSGADKVTVTLRDGRVFTGEVTGTDQITDLAVVKINPDRGLLPTAPLGDSDQIKVGDWAIAVGNPVGLDNTVTLGIISTLHRSAAEVGISDKRIDFLQTDAAINPGNSGGPLLNADGEVIGINTAIRADAMGIGFAIPINKAKELQQVLALGQEVPHPYIGIQMVDITPDLARRNNQNPNSSFFLPEVQGVLVVQVLGNTPAEKAGIRRGDIITRVDGLPLEGAGQLQELVEKVGVNHYLSLSLLRGETTLNVKVKTAQLS